MNYTRLVVTPSDATRREAVSAALFVAGAEGVLEEGATLVSVFGDPAVATLAEQEVRAVDHAALVESVVFDPGDYDAEWRASVKPRQVGRLLVTPPWLAGASDPATTLVIEPGTGFGTGEHETTRGALFLLQDVVHAGDVVADLGCGSAVLAIAAAKLGAARVAAIELDGEAISNAEENVAHNGLADRITVIEGDAGALLPLLAPVRVVVANIISSVLVELLPIVAPSLTPDGVVVIGGVLVVEREAFIGVIAADGWRVVREYAEGEWWAAELHRADR
jgi:ribosomal protein L11 methyltransferase